MAYYDEISEGYDGLHREEQLKKLNIIKENIKIKKSDKMLDVGCGTGFSRDFFDCDWTGIDPSEKMLKKCRGKCLKASAEKIPFPDKSFDIVVSVTAMHNFDDIEKGLKEMERVGRGRFVFSVLKKSRKFKSIKALIEKMFNVNKVVEEEKDVVFFCLNSLITLF